MLTLQNNFNSTNSYEEAIYYFINKVETRGYTCEPVNYTPLTENEINPMILAYAEKSLSDVWDASNEEENAYWESFITD